MSKKQADARPTRRFRQPAPLPWDLQPVHDRAARGAAPCSASRPPWAFVLTSIFTGSRNSTRTGAAPGEQGASGMFQPKATRRVVLGSALAMPFIRTAAAQQTYEWV